MLSLKSLLSLAALCDAKTTWDQLDGSYGFSDYVKEFQKVPLLFYF